MRSVRESRGAWAPWKFGQSLVGIAFAVLALVWTSATPTWAAPAVRIGLQASGTFSWVTHVIDKYKLDEANGFDMVTTTYATKTAAELALRAGEVDVVVDDFIGVTRLRQQGIAVKAIYPFSLAVGSLVVPKESKIQSIADLKGKKVGVASLDDKSWLILRAAAIRKHGFDPQVAGAALAVAPPLMSQFLSRGDLDAALPYWHFVARMVAGGEYRVVASVAQLLEQIDLPSELPILVIVATEAAIRSNRAGLESFLSAVEQAWQRMATDQAIWEDLVNQGLYSLPDRSLLPAVRKAWVESVPKSWDATTVQALVGLVQRLTAVAGADVVGIEQVDRAAFAMDLVPRKGR